MTQRIWHTDWTILTGKAEVFGEKRVPSSNFSITNPARTDPVFHSELHSARQATNPPNDGTVAVTWRNWSTQCYVLTTPENCWRRIILSIQKYIKTGGGRKGVKTAICLTHQADHFSTSFCNFQLRYYVACCFVSPIVRKWTTSTEHDDDYGDGDDDDDDDDDDADDDNNGSHVV